MEALRAARELLEDGVGEEEEAVARGRQDGGHVERRRDRVQLEAVGDVLRAVPADELADRRTGHARRRTVHEVSTEHAAQLEHRRRGTRKGGAKGVGEGGVRGRGGGGRGEREGWGREG